MSGTSEWKVAEEKKMDIQHEEMGAIIHERDIQTS
jgi:hypothetical protein